VSHRIRRPIDLGTVDVLIVGAGCAGAVAAEAAARAGASVVLVERDGTLGGTSTAVLDTFYGFYAPGAHSARIVGGIPAEVVSELTAATAAFERPNTYGAGTGVTYNPEVLRVVWDRRCHAAGVTTLLHTSMLDVTVESGRVEAVRLVSGSELLEVRPTVTVDASGDGVVAYLAGAASEGFTDIPNPQAMTVTFTMSPVDEAAVAAVGRDGLLARLGEARDTGAYDLPRKEGSLHATTVPGVTFVHMTRVAGRDPRDPLALAQAEREGRAQALEYARFLVDRVPGFADARLTWMSRRAGVRESRRVRGRYWLERDDVLGGHRFDDAVAQGAAPIEEHTDGSDTRWEYGAEGATYDIPYRSLVVAGVEGLLVAGRCFSASHDAHASARNMGQCMAMGQAAGEAAALAVSSHADVFAVDVPELQARLARNGALFGGVVAGRPVVGAR
jgi:2-polyprenyl-6-methoxyphenol hydroxylase-like FAD-dependent oxidoreductase